MSPDQPTATTLEAKSRPDQAETVLISSPEAIILITTDLIAEVAAEPEFEHGLERAPVPETVAPASPRDLSPAPAPVGDQQIDRFMAEMSLPKNLEQTDVRLSS